MKTDKAAQAALLHIGNTTGIKTQPSMFDVIIKVVFEAMQIQYDKIAIAVAYTHVHWDPMLGF
ncbi:MAG: hypothetical protein AB8B95_04990 [Pseudohongiellaceae bacterium]